MRLELSSVSPDFPEAAWFGSGVCPIWNLLAIGLWGVGGGGGDVDHMTTTSSVEYLDIVI